MCIIIWKPEGKKLPKQSILENCFENNPDGAGFMYRAPDGSIVIKKGFMTFRSFIEAFKNEIPKNRVKSMDIAIHFRIATHGNVTPGNCHPFPLTRRFTDLHELSANVPRALMHNGILDGYSSPDHDLSDSGMFAKMLYPCHTDKQYLSVLSIHATAGTSRFILMTGDATYKAGNFITVGGCEFSNTSYLRREWHYVPYSKIFDGLSFGIPDERTNRMIQPAPDNSTTARGNIHPREKYPDPDKQTERDRKFREYLMTEGYDRYGL